MDSRNIKLCYVWRDNNCWAQVWVVESHSYYKWALLSAGYIREATHTSNNGALVCCCSERSPCPPNSQTIATDYVFYYNTRIAFKNINPAIWWAWKRKECSLLFIMNSLKSFHIKNALLKIRKTIIIKTNKT